MVDISIVLTTYNGASRGYLDKTIKSVLNQTYKDYELIIIDDGSVDNTKELCQKFLKDKNIRYLFKKNGGPASARNFGINNSKGSYICILDDDDLWKSDKLEKQIKFFKGSKDKKIGMVFTSIEFIEEDGTHRRNQSHIAEGNIYKKLFYENIVDATSSVMIKKEVFNKTGLFLEDELIKGCEDYEMWIRIARYYHIYSLNNILVKYRLHSDSLSTDRKKREIALYIALCYALQNDKGINRNKVFSNYYRKIAIDRLLRRNYYEFRKYFMITLAYGGASFYLRVMYIISFLITLFRLLIKLLRFGKNKIIKPLLFKK